MKVHQSVAKIYAQLRDEAARGSAMQVVVTIESWARNLEKALERGEKIDGRIVHQTCPNNSGFQANYAYRALRMYWEHKDLLPWKSFLNVPLPVKHPTHKARKKVNYLPIRNCH